MEALKRFFLSHKYFFCILAFLLFYEWSVVGLFQIWRVGEVTYSFHALDFSMGLGSFILPGQVYQWICGPIEEWSLTVYHTVLILCFFLLISAFLERLMLSVKKKDRLVAGTLIALFLTGPSTFSIFITDLGMPEVYWVYIAAVFFLLLAYKPLCLLAAPLCVLALMVNYAAIICYVPFFCIMLLYRLSGESEKSAKRILTASFVLCVSASLAGFFYFSMNTMRNMTLSFEEYNALMRSRGVTELSYIDSLLYGRYEVEIPAELYASMTASPFYAEGDRLSLLQQLVNLVLFRLYTVRYHLSQRNPLQILVPLFAILPVAGLIFRFCFREAKNRKNTVLRRFVFFCIMVLPAVCISVAWLLSFDFFKWIDFAFLPLFASFLYVFYREKEAVAAYMREAVRWFSFPQILVYCSVYAVCVLHAYY